MSGNVIKIDPNGELKQVNPNSDFISSKGIILKQMPEEPVNQVSHGFSVGNILRWDSVGGEFVLSQADSAENAEVYGIVSDVIDSDNFKIGSTKGGKLSGFSGLTPGQVYFLSSETAGQYTSSPPTTVGEISKCIFQAISETEMVFHNYLGIEIEVYNTVLPNIETGDGDKVLVVKTDESGAEWRDPLLINPDLVTNNFTAGETISVGDTVGVSYGSSDGKVYKCLADTSGKYQFIGLAMEAGDLDDEILVCVYGKWSNSNLSFNSSDYGKNIFASVTVSGDLDISPDVSSSGNVLLPVGIILGSDTIFIKPGYPSITE